MNLSKTFAAVQYASRKLLALNDEKDQPDTAGSCRCSRGENRFYPCRKPERH